MYTLVVTVVPREIKDNACAKLRGANKVYYGKCENGEYGAYAKVFLSNLHQPEVGLFHFSGSAFAHTSEYHLYYCQHSK